MAKTNHEINADAPIIIVMLRQPKMSCPQERRTDPLWEFGSFGLTGCHRTNLMHHKRLTENAGVRFAFAQNGFLGTRLVYITPPLTTFNHGNVSEVKWRPAAMPLSYNSAPVLIDNNGQSDIEGMIALISDVKRSSPVAKFASKFRSSRKALPTNVGEELLRVYTDIRRNKETIIATSYIDALPYHPPLIDREREETYQKLLKNASLLQG